MAPRQMKQTHQHEGYPETRVWRWIPNGTYLEDPEALWISNDTLVYIQGWTKWNGVMYAKVEKISDCDVAGWCAMHNLVEVPKYACDWA